MIGKFTYRIIVDQMAKTPDGTGGFTLAASNLTTVWGDVDLAESEARELGEKIIRSAVYVVKTRKSPALDTLIAINQLRFTVNTGEVLYPKEYKIKKEFIEWKCSDRHEG